MYFLPDVPPIMRLRGFLYSLMMKRCGRDFQVTASAVINSLAGLSVGSHVYIAQFTVVTGPQISIGNEVMFGPHCVIIGGNHQYSGSSYRFAKSVAEPIVIEDGCWIGAHCTILAGTVLPSESILGAGSVLDKSQQQPRSLYAGTPARLVKSL